MGGTRENKEGEGLHRKGKENGEEAGGVEEKGRIIENGRGKNEGKGEGAREKENEGKEEKEKKKEEKKEIEVGNKWEGRLRSLEESIEKKEKEERRRKNVIIKRVPKEKGDWRWGVEKLLKEIGAEVRINEMRRINTGREEKGEMVWVRLKREEDKRIVWDKKKRLKGRKVWIEKDLSWKERGDCSGREEEGENGLDGG
ncbi:histone-lysine N-methyltransferase, H3 lysine-79 specific-like [Pseudomyrmex gracilis]|uniref:histone-lysine N-methyltransferase, H3 lysine-79 specific-like n=1 Tax=Pseudomyrmex gracilis TaxID=219809 RepID=UPI000994BDB8|nr:histone-lysine N-methyltransferase, H3 lysine-79 specific-like [Pseudomyrmex gracilis]